MPEECREGGYRERVFHPEESGEEREDQSRTRDVSVKEDRGGEESAGRTLSGSGQLGGRARRSSRPGAEDRSG